MYCLSSIFHKFIFGLHLRGFKSWLWIVFLWVSQEAFSPLQVTGKNLGGRARKKHLKQVVSLGAVNLGLLEGRLSESVSCPETDRKEVDGPQRG